MTLLSYHPFKALYILAAVWFEVSRLPFWLLKYLFSFGRPHPNYTFRQALGLRIVSSFVHHSAAVRLHTPLPLTPGREKGRWVVIEPAEQKYYKGPLESNPDVKPERIGGTWYPAKLTREGVESKKKDIMVCLHVHGGAFVIGDGRTGASGYFAKKITAHTGVTHVFKPQYRLSKLPASKTSNPFPAAIQDSLASYLYLLHDLKIPASQIVLSGDSAGANAAISLLRYLTEFGGELNIPNPVAAWLWSPWVEPRNALPASSLISNPNYSTDYLPPAFTVWGAHAYAGLSGPSFLSNPYISSLKHPFRTPVPLWVNTGGKEVLFGEDCEFVEKMRAEGNRIELDVEEMAPHDVCLIGGILGMDGEATRCAERAGGWLGGVRRGEGRL
ncbi:alpha/beta-hydrolase [Delitschia confertaspora ATCC 74209]|uniref:Alpha/beta-hydrolase n=1 Tax=Delitschia confertaspora ATCC 74209 TaxID=1513339 RepID=A0A9P4JPD9_9PLEO|nr:alpha/beta-hydrolase [Delitschia confertaspora ATCC 74209]